MRKVSGGAMDEKREGREDRKRTDQLSFLRT